MILLGSNGTGRMILDEIILHMAQQRYYTLDMAGRGMAGSLINELAYIAATNKQKFDEFITISNLDRFYAAKLADEIKCVLLILGVDSDE